MQLLLSLLGYNKTLDTVGSKLNISWMSKTHICSLHCWQKVGIVLLDGSSDFLQFFVYQKFQNAMRTIQGRYTVTVDTGQMVVHSKDKRFSMPMIASPKPQEDIQCDL